jgi:hypothetical protein
MLGDIIEWQFANKIFIEPTNHYVVVNVKKHIEYVYKE